MSNCFTKSKPIVFCSEIIETEYITQKFLEIYNGCSYKENCISKKTLGEDIAFNESETRQIKITIATSIDLIMDIRIYFLYQDQNRHFFMLQKKHKITDRELEIIKLLYRRFTEKEISEELHISINTVKTHKRSIYEKINISSRKELIKLIDC